MAKHKNLAKVYTATTGTGTLTLGSAVPGFKSFADAGVSNGDVVTYAIRSGNDTEIGRGTYTSSGTTLSRDTVLESTNSDAKISCSGTSQVGIVLAAEDLQGIADLTPTNNYVVMGDGSALAAVAPATAFGAIKQSASDTATGVVELATTAEAITGTDTARAVTPAGIAAVIPNGGATGDVLAKSSSSNRATTWVTPLTISDGTWTPVLTASTTGGSHTYSTQLGTYIKIGPLVFFTCHLALSTKDATLSGSVRISGLPFTVRNVSSEFNLSTPIAASVDLTAGRTIYALASINTSYLTLGEQGDNVVQANLTAAAIGNTSSFFISGHYFTSL
jgi:hypothetical protein